MKVFLMQAALALALAPGCASNQGGVPSTTESKSARRSYTQPLSTPGARFGSLPANVQTTVLSEAGTAEIADVIKDVVNGKIVYKIHFRESGTYPPLFVSADGSVLNLDLSVAVPVRQMTSSALKLADLPPNVAKVVQEKAPDAEIASISEETWGTHVVYTVNFKDEARFPKLLVVGDGTVLHQ